MRKCGTLYQINQTNDFPTKSKARMNQLEEYQPIIVDFIKC